MSAAFSKVKEEIRNVLVVAVFFSIGFCLIHVSNKLFTAGSSGVEMESLSRAVIGGFIAAKVLYTVDCLPFVHVFPGKPLIHNIVWKSALYAVGALVFMCIEPLVKSLFKGRGWSASQSAALHVLTLPRTWAVEIWVVMLLVAFVTLQELSRVLGKEQLRYLFFGRKGQPAREESFRDAA